MAKAAPGPGLGHWSLDDIATRLKGFAPPPDGEYNPQGAWEQTYYITMARPVPLSADGKVGTVRLTRAPSTDGYSLRVEQMTKLPTGTQRTVASLACSTDAVGSVRSWELESITLDKQGKETPVTRLKDTGRIEARRIVRAGLSDVARNGAMPITSNWSLMEAVQRLSPSDEAPRFEMLDELDAMRRRQRIAVLDPIDLPTGATKTRLTGFCQMGEGVLPTFYWIDARKRLLFVTQGYKALVWQSA